MTIFFKNNTETLFSEDEEFKKVIFERISSLDTIFQKDNGTVTVANSSKLSDGACSLLLANNETIKRLNLMPLAKVIGFCDAATDPINVFESPIYATQKLLKQTGLNKEDISMFEINEAFSVVALAIIKTLGLDPNKVNVNGGAISLGLF